MPSQALVRYNGFDRRGMSNIIEEFMKYENISANCTHFDTDLMDVIHGLITFNGHHGDNSRFIARCFIKTIGGLPTKEATHFSTLKSIKQVEFVLLQLDKTTNISSESMDRVHQCFKPEPSLARCIDSGKSANSCPHIYILCIINQMVFRSMRYLKESISLRTPRGRVATFLKATEYMQYKGTISKVQDFKKVLLNYAESLDHYKRCSKRKHQEDEMPPLKRKKIESSTNSTNPFSLSEKLVPKLRKFLDDFESDPLAVSKKEILELINQLDDLNNITESYFSERAEQELRTCHSRIKRLWPDITPAPENPMDLIATCSQQLIKVYKQLSTSDMKHFYQMISAAWKNSPTEFKIKFKSDAEIEAEAKRGIVSRDTVIQKLIMSQALLIQGDDPSHSFKERSNYMVIMHTDVRKLLEADNKETKAASAEKENFIKEEEKEEESKKNIILLDVKDEVVEAPLPAVGFTAAPPAVTAAPPAVTAAPQAVTAAPQAVTAAPPEVTAAPPEVDGTAETSVASLLISPTGEATSLGPISTSAATSTGSSHGDSSEEAPEEVPADFDGDSGSSYSDSDASDIASDEDL